MKNYGLIALALLVSLSGCKKSSDDQNGQTDQSQNSGGGQSQAAPESNFDILKKNNLKTCINGSLYFVNVNQSVLTPVYESIGGGTPQVKTCDGTTYSDNFDDMGQ